MKGSKKLINSGMTYIQAEIGSRRIKLQITTKQMVHVKIGALKRAFNASPNLTEAG